MNSEAKVGLFVLVTLAVIAFFILRTTDGMGLPFLKKPAPKQAFEVVLTDASGLRQGTNVKVAGIKVGEVTTIRLENGLAIAVLSVDADIQLRSGAEIKLQTQGVLGERYVALLPGNGEPLAKPIRLEGHTPPGLDAISGKIAPILDDLKAITAALRAGISQEDGTNRIDNIARNVEKLSELLVTGFEDNRRHIEATTENMAIISQEFRKSIPALLENIRAVSEELRLLAQTNRPNMDRTMQNVQSMTSRLDNAAESLNSIADKINRGQGTIGKLINDDETAGKIDQILDTANEALAEAKKFVDQASNLDLELGLQGEYLEKHQATRSAFQLKISPNKNKYYLVEIFSRDVDYFPITTTQETEETYDADGNLITTTIRTQEEEEDDTGFSGQLAYRVGPIFLRGGLIEGEGGAGIDYVSEKYKSTLGIEALDFSRPEDLDPRVRIFWKYDLPQRLHFKLGYEDLLESDLGTAYMGLGIRWKDDDLKPLLGSMGRAF